MKLNRLSLTVLEVKSFVTRVDHVNICGGQDEILPPPPPHMATCQTLIKSDRCCYLAVGDGGIP